MEFGYLFSKARKVSICYRPDPGNKSVASVHLLFNVNRVLRGARHRKQFVGATSGAIHDRSARVGRVSRLKFQNKMVLATALFWAVRLVAASIYVPEARGVSGPAHLTSRALRDRAKDAEIVVEVYELPEVMCNSARYDTPQTRTQDNVDRWTHVSSAHSKPALGYNTFNKSYTEQSRGLKNVTVVYAVILKTLLEGIGLPILLTVCGFTVWRFRPVGVGKHPSLLRTDRNLLATVRPPLGWLLKKTNSEPGVLKNTVKPAQRRTGTSIRSRRVNIGQDQHTRLLLDVVPIGIVVFDTQFESATCNGPARRLLGDLLNAEQPCVVKLLSGLHSVQTGVSLLDLLRGTLSPSSSCEVMGPGAIRLWVKTERVREYSGRRETIVMSITEFSDVVRNPLESTEVLDFASHDIRLMLNAARGHLQSICMEEVSQAAKQRVALAQQCVASSFKLTESLLATMSLERADAVTMKNVSLAEIVGSVCEDAQIGNTDKQFVLNCDLSEPALVRGNYSFLYRAIFNVVDNALKFSPRGSIVTVGLFFDSNHVTLQVTDQGAGFPTDLLAPGSGTSIGGVGKRAGFGLGLRFVRQIAKTHNIKLSFRNLEIRGAIVDMVFLRQIVNDAAQRPILLN
jgi:signal transduction histidine kinase